jgi:hypothetical protein
MKTIFKNKMRRYVLLLLHDINGKTGFGFEREARKVTRGCTCEIFLGYC